MMAHFTADKSLIAVYRWDELKECKGKLNRHMTIDGEDMNHRDNCSMC